MQPIQSQLKTALEHHQAGKRDQAEPIYRGVLEADPEDPDALHLLGMLLHETGRHDEALGLVRRAVAQRPDEGTLHNALGVVLLALDRLPEAEEAFGEAMRLQPDAVEAYENLAALLERLGRFDEAEECLAKILDMHPERAKTLFALAKLYERLSVPEKLVAHCVRSLKANNAFAPAHLLLGLALASRIAPEHRAKLDLAERASLGDKALYHLRRAVALVPSAETITALGKGVLRTNRHAEAIETFRSALSLDPKHAVAHQDLGKVYLELGRIEEARTQFHKAISLDPGCVEARYELSRMGRTDDPEGEARQLRGLLDQQGLAPREQMLARFALARRLDEQADYDAAFEQYAAANRVKEDIARRRHGGEPRSPDKAAGPLDRQRDVFDAAFFQQREGWGSESELPVLIVGMPRSGTTLVEQILSSHPQVHGAGELTDVADLALSLPRRLQTDTPRPEAARSVTPELAEAMAEEYLAQLRKRSATSVRTTDKMPTNFRHLGLVALLLPRARVIHVRRDPLDVCVSCFRQNLEWPFCDLEAVARYWRGYERLMEHWRSVLKLRICEVQYEQLVHDHETESRRLIDFCGLAWDDRCLEFATTDRPVQTPSKWQVRQPIYRSSVGNWRKYASHLGPLKQALGIA
jgi:tetratricopeptide (TPR) repeat protein